jgi:DNA polymerase III alpha subunit
MSKKKNTQSWSRSVKTLFTASQKMGNCSRSAIRRGVDEKTAKDIFDEMMDFARYAFINPMRLPMP